MVPEKKIIDSIGWEKQSSALTFFTNMINPPRPTLLKINLLIIFEVDLRQIRTRTMQHSKNRKSDLSWVVFSIKSAPNGNVCQVNLFIGAKVDWEAEWRMFLKKHQRCLFLNREKGSSYQNRQSEQEIFYSNPSGSISSRRIKINGSFASTYTLFSFFLFFLNRELAQSNNKTYFNYLLLSIFFLEDRFSDWLFGNKSHWYDSWTLVFPP